MNSTATLQLYGDWTNEGSATLPGTVAFVGSVAQTAGNTAFGQLLIDKPNGGLTLSSDIGISQQLTLSRGLLRTAAARVVLAAAATIHESETSYVLGEVQAERVLDVAGRTEDFGGLGVELTPHGSILPDYTLVLRTTGSPLTSPDGQPGISRYFSITPLVDLGLNVDMTFRYFEHELNGLAEGSLRLLKSETGVLGPWATMLSTTASVLDNDIDQINNMMDETSTGRKALLYKIAVIL